jgi:uncharacterized protein YjiK
VDLSTYVRVGRYDLPEPTRTTAPAGNLLGQEASGVAYNWDTDTLFIIGDGGRSITEISKSGELVSTMTLAAGDSPQGTAFYDPEGITYVGNGQFVFTEERDRNAVLISYEADAVKGRDDAQIANLGRFVNNIGLEGLSYDPLTGGFIFVKESGPIGVFQTSIDFETNTASNGSATTENSADLFDPALLGLSDVADVFALSNIPSFAGTADEGNLLIISQEEGKIVKVDRAGNVLSELVIQTDAGNVLGVADQQHEGITVDRNGFIYVVSENGGGDADHPQLWVYAPADFPNEAPIDITLDNALAAIEENTGTSSRVKVADILIKDDGIGVNALSLSGADAASFQVDSTGLYLKAGTELDYEIKASYAVTVSVDDANVGSGTDASVDYVLNVTDVEDEVVAPTVFISEVAPWSSANSPVGADWFEVTNNGGAAIDITGWRMDDSSAQFSNARALTGVPSIGAGQSVIFFETTDLAATTAAFIENWFGGVAPPGVQFGAYTGAGVGLSTGGDQVNLYNAAGEVQASVSFGASPSDNPYATFNNAAAINNAEIPILSEAGSNGAFAVTHGETTEVGSPGTVGKLFVSEIAPWSSGDSPVGADWFEVTNTTGLAMNIAGWKVDDNSQSPIAAVALNGIDSIKAGESVIFVNGGNTEIQAFIANWFGGSRPAGVQIGTYEGSGIGLSTSGDQVNLYDAGNTLRASVVFGTSTSLPSLGTFDNAAGVNGTVAQISSIGVNGAYQVQTTDGTETGSPGSIKTVVDQNNAAPTSIVLTNTTTAIEENSSTLARVKVADVSVSDDGRGGNALALVGADAAFFEIDTTGLYLKAGTNLDFEAKTAFSVTVTVDDPTVGATPDASTDFLLNVTDVVDEGTGPAIRITEAAPWASGDSPVGFDWFEVTNFSDAAVDISGWRVDDDSKSFGSSIALNGVSVVAAGQSVIFLQTDNLAQAKAAFIDNWFAGEAPSSLTFGTYDGSGIGLSAGGDSLNLFNTAGAVMANVAFGASTGLPALATFDNADGLNNVLLSNLATAGTNGAFTILNDEGNAETGSPGYIAPSMIIGDAGDNTLSGTILDDIIEGGAGNDTLTGLGGSDRLLGGAGSDTMRGGANSDVFGFTQSDDVAPANGTKSLDRIVDFSSEDVLITDAKLFDSNSNGVITFGHNRLLDLTGGGQVSMTNSSGKRITALEFDGIWHDDATGTDHYVYSLVGSAAGVSTLDLFA